MKNDEKTASQDPPAPEVLKPQEDGDKAPIESNAPAVAVKKPKITNIKLRHSTYRPSHKATFIGIAVVIVILAVNAAIILFVLSDKEQASTDTNKSEVVISTDVLDKLGVSRNPIDTAGTELAIGPNTTFGGTVTVGGNTSIGGQLSLNGKLSVTDASISKLQAGDTSFSKINVSGDGTLSNLNLRNDLIVVGSTKLQGAVTVNQLMTVYNNMNVSGNLAVGGTLSMGAFQTNTLTVGGHITTRGSAPSVSPGSSAVLGSNGTISISGNDVAGTVAVNTGVGASSGGIVAYVTFVNAYTNVPHVVVTAVGGGMGGVYVNRNATGFSIGVNGVLSPGGYAIDYIVMQ